MERKRPRAHEIALEIVRPTEAGVLAAIARDRECGVEHLPARLVADVRSELMRGMRPLLEELARLSDPHAFSVTPLADELEPELRPESTNLRPVSPVTPSARPTAPPPPGYAGWVSEEEKTPVKLVDDYPQIEMSEMDFADMETPAETPRAKATSRTTPSFPPPPPDVLSAKLKRPKG